MPTRETPERPSTFNERVEERTEIEPEDDYSVTGDSDPAPDTYGFPPEDQQPVPIYLVEPPPVQQEIVKWSGNRYTVTNRQSVLLAGDNRARKRMLVTNHDATASVFLTPDEDTNTDFMPEVVAGATVELFSNTRVYAICDDTNTEANVSIIQEWVVNDDDDY